MADTSLIFSIIARDKTGTVFKKLQMQAASTGRLVGMALGPALAPVAAVGTGAILGLGASLGAAGIAAGVFGGVMATAVKETTDAATKFQQLHDKIELYGREAQILKARGEDNSKVLKKQADAMLELEARLRNMPQAQRDATIGLMGMKSTWQNFVDANKPAVFADLARGYGIAATGISKLQPFFDIAQQAVERLLHRVQDLVGGKGLATLAQRAGPAMNSLVSIILNVGTAVGRMMGKFAGQGQGVLNWIEGMTARWVRWTRSTTANTGLNSFFNYVRQNGPQTVALLASLAGAAMHIAQAVAPLAPISMAVAGALASLISAIPPPVITALVAAWIAFGIGMKAYAVYSGIATAAQWAQNAAFLASPITWIILAVIALVAVIVLVATKTRFFQTIWGAVWGFMKGVGAWFAGPFANFFVSMWNKIVASLNRARQQFMTVINAIVAYYRWWWNIGGTIINAVIAGWNKMVAFFRSAPGRVRSALAGMFSGLWSGFRNYVNKIIGAWNRLHFGIPGTSFAGVKIPGIQIGTPDLPYLDRGGRITSDGIAYVHKQEEVVPAKVTRSSYSGSGGGLTIRGDGSRVAAFLLEILREAIRDKGGDPIKVLRPR